MGKTHLVLGATGHVGSAVARHLLERGERVVALVHDPKKAEALRTQGAEIAEADVHDPEALRALLAKGESLFLLNPPAPPDTDTVAEERRSVAAILEAVRESGLKHLVAQSTYGAQPGERLGDLGVLYEMEQALARGPIPHVVLRAAYFMSNWDAALEIARSEGKLPTLYPPDFRLPMVAPDDIGRVAARLLTDDESTGIHHVEGPALYSSADVADAFAKALGRSVEAVPTSREAWIPALRKMGFSEPAAESMAHVTALTLKGPESPESPERGPTTLDAYVAALVEHRGRGSSNGSDA